MSADRLALRLAAGALAPLTVDEIATLVQPLLSAPCAREDRPQGDPTRTTTRTTCAWPGCGQPADDRGWWTGDPTCSYHWNDDGPWEPDR